MPTLQEIIEGDLGATAPAPMDKEAAVAVGEPDEIEKLAMEIGIVDAVPAVSEPTQGQTKEAKMGLESLYSGLFGEDVAPSAAAEKTAALNKEAAEVEEAMGKAAYDAFQVHVDKIITKIATDKIAEGATVDHSGDAETPRTMDNNRAGADGKPIDTKPVVDNEIKPENGGAVVGHEASPAHGEGELKHAAYRKHLLLTQIEK